MLRVITFNLNGIRSAYRKGWGEWLAAAKADIVCYQEVRAAPADITTQMQQPANLCGEFVFPQKRGYSGVGILAARPPLAVHRRLGGGKDGDILENEARFLRMDFDNLSVISLYMPSGSSGDERQSVKRRIMTALYPQLLAYRQEADDCGRDFLLCGDINIAHTEKDIRNWRGNRNNSGFLPEERAWLTQLFSDAGWSDVFRRINDNDGEYTWWSNRGRARENNVGWRIDYQIATPNFAARARRAEIIKTPRFSDHAPLLIDYHGRW